MDEKTWRLYGRKKPYTNEEIAKLPCFRCGRPAVYQWQICSDGNIYRPICEVCDVDLQVVVLNFMRFPASEIAAKMEAYRRRVNDETGT